MKKKLLFLLLVLTMPINVTTASQFWSTQKHDDLKLVKEEVRYRYYKPVKKGEYTLRGQKNTSYLYEDKEDIIYSPFSDEYEECPSNINEEYDIKKTNIYTKIFVPKIRYIEITFSETAEDSATYLYFNETERKFEYSIHENKLIIDLEDDYSVKDMAIAAPQVNSISFIKSNMEEVFTITDLSSGGYYNIFDYLTVNQDSFPKLISNDDSSEDDYIIINAKEMCQKRLAYTYRYNIEKQYYGNGYYAATILEDYLPDLETATKFYLYEKIDKTFNLIDNIFEVESLKNNTIKVEEEKEEKKVTIQDNKNLGINKEENQSYHYTPKHEFVTSNVSGSQNKIKIRVIVIIMITGFTFIFAISYLLFYLHKKKNVDETI